MSHAPGHHVARTAILAILVSLGGATHAQEAAPPEEAPSREPAATITPAPSLIITNQGEVRTAYLHAIVPEGIVIRDRAGSLDEIHHSRFLATVATHERAEAVHGIGGAPIARNIDLDRIRVQVEAEQVGVVELVDGQRYPGLPASPDAGSEESLRWDVRAGSEATFTLERIARIIYPWAGIHRHTLPRDATEDLVVLINGDELAGFVASVGDVINIETDAGIVEVEQERIAGIVLANPSEPSEDMMLWLDDATVARADTIAARAGRLFIETPLGVRIAPEVEHVRAYTHNAARIVPLSSITPTSQAPVGDRWRADPILLRTHPDDLLASDTPALGALDVHLPGAMRIDYELPQGAQRFVATAALAPEAGQWADCKLVITVAGEELLRLHLHEQAPRAAINVALDDARAGTTFAITLEPGRYGPIRNQLTLHRPLIITDE